MELIVNIRKITFWKDKKTKWYVDLKKYFENCSPR